MPVTPCGSNKWKAASSTFSEAACEAAAQRGLEKVRVVQRSRGYAPDLEDHVTADPFGEGVRHPTSGGGEQQQQPCAHTTRTTAAQPLERALAL
eukprot:CAMPEP_0179839038 /NCGR_PEP_ID=MMETSP0982-20121206/1069_1 /TAXON_ID=483367 /ORGANISM="non described non described, Strain CCMP 2436" /LENGTH=93 /DNA_ID=CAMNT_0021722595 /DNA_START=551 /DNA_END=828 /DNA_ORIENTATION=-